MSTKSEPGVFDGFEKAEPNEPVFTLIGRDRFAPQTIHHWIGLRRQHVANEDMKPEKRAAELTQLREAEELAWRFEEWRNGQEEIPESQPEPIRSYSGNTLDADELAAKAKHDAVKNAARIMNNAVAELTDIYPIIASERDEVDYGDFIAAVETIKIMAEMIAPKRSSYSHRG